MKITPSTPVKDSDINRRKFLINTAKSAGGLALFSLQPFFDTENISLVKNQLTVQQVMDIILKEGGLSPM